MIPLLSAYSALTVKGSGSSSSSGSTTTSYNFSESYSTIYVSSTTYKISIQTTEGNTNLTETVWVLKSGTAVAIDTEGQNFTGSEAQEFIIGAFAGFELQLQADAQVSYYTNTGFFHSTGTSTVSIGPTSVKVTSYSANTLPETVSECGDVTTLTAFSLSVGTPQGASLPLVTSENISGSDSSGNFSFSLNVSSITLA